MVLVDMHILFLSTFGLKVIFRAKEIYQKDSLLKQPTAGEKNVGLNVGFFSTCKNKTPKKSKHLQIKHSMGLIFATD